MDALEEWIRVNSYLVYGILFFYCAMKSGALPLFAAIFASTDDLSIFAVSAASFLGGYLGDEARFYLARRYGDYLTSRLPRLGVIVKRAEGLLARHGAKYIFLYRYPKGMRTIGAFPVGLSNMSWLRFTVFNAGSAALWTTLLVAFGYVFGVAIVETVERNWGWLSVVALGVFASLVWLVYRNNLTSAQKGLRTP